MSADDDEEFLPVVSRRRGDLVDDESVEISAKYKEPLTRIDQNDDEWILGSSLVGKTMPEGGSHWRARWDASSRFYVRKVSLADGRVIVGVVLRITDKSTAGTPIEQLSGWVPAEKETDALLWIEFLNSEIRRTLTRKPDEKTDADHYRYMLEHGGRINGIVEAKDSWGHGGNVWIAKDQPVFKVGPYVIPLRASTHYYRSKFTVEAGGKRVAGWALWFQPDPRDASRFANGRVLCGWTDDGNKAASWVDFLNHQIRARLAEAASRPAPEPKDEAAEEAAATARFQGSMTMLRGLGLHVPDAKNVDELVTKLEEQTREGPIDSRSRIVEKKTE